MTPISPATSELPPFRTAHGSWLKPQDISMENQRRDDSPSGLSDIVEGDGLLGTGITVSLFQCRGDPSTLQFEADHILGTLDPSS